MLLGHEWTHWIGVVPLTLHQRIAIWREGGIVEGIEAYQSYYKAEIGKVWKKYFDMNLAKIQPWYIVEKVYLFEKDFTYSLNLYPNYGFIWDKEQVESKLVK